MMDTLGPKNVLEYAKRFGFEEDFPPYLPIALGAGDATLSKSRAPTRCSRIRACG